MPPIRVNDEGSNIESYSWPGNIRQLRNLVERLSVIAQDRTITPEVLEQNLPANRSSEGTQHWYRNTPTLLKERAPIDKPTSNLIPMRHSPPSTPCFVMSKGNVGELTQLLYRLLQSQQIVHQPLPSIAPPAHNPIMIWVTRRRK